MTNPDVFDLIAELRRTLGLFDGAMPITPKQAWDEAIAAVEQMKAGRCWKCMKQDTKRWVNTASTTTTSLTVSSPSNVHAGGTAHRSPASMKLLTAMATIEPP